MTKGQFTPDEWKLMLNAPHWVYAALAAAERGSISTRRTEAKALEEFLSGYKTRSPLVKEIITGQNEADDKLEGGLKDAERMLGQVGTLLERKVSDEEGDAVRNLLLQAGEAIAKATREALFGDAKSAGEEKTLALVAAALKATDADKRRRHEAAVAQSATLAKQAKEAEAQAAAEAKKKAQEAEAKRLAAEAEAQKRAAEAKAKQAAAEAEAKKNTTEEAEAKKAAQAAAKKRVEEVKAKRLAAEAEAQKKAAEAEAQKQAAEAAAATAETGRIYVVKSGDTLSGIAKQMYGKAARWPEIFEANKDIIKNPNLIRPGWKLRIPD